jgi:hypothetical protein
MQIEHANVGFVPAADIPLGLNRSSAEKLVGCCCRWEIFVAVGSIYYGL